MFIQTYVSSQNVIYWMCEFCNKIEYNFESDLLLISSVYWDIFPLIVLYTVIVFWSRRKITFASHRYADTLFNSLLFSILKKGTNTRARAREIEVNWTASVGYLRLCLIHTNRLYHLWHSLNINDSREGANEQANKKANVWFIK